MKRLAQCMLWWIIMLATFPLYLFINWMRNLGGTPIAICEMEAEALIEKRIPGMRWILDQSGEFGIH